MHRRALLLFLLLAPVAAAQLGLAQISIAADGEGPTLDMGESAVATFTVSNPATAGLDLEVTVSVIELPPGWGATLDVGQFTLASGESRQVSLTLEPTDQAALGDAEFIVEARGAYSLGLLGQDVDEVTDSDTLTAHLRPAPTDATDWIPVWLIPVLIVAAVAAAGFAVWGARRGIRVTPAASRLEAPAGTLAVLPVQVRNRSGSVQRVNLTVHCDDETWRPGVTPDAVQLPVGQSREVELQVIVPKEATGPCKVRLHAESDSGRRSRTMVRFGLA